MAPIKVDPANRVVDSGETEKTLPEPHAVAQRSVPDLLCEPERVPQDRDRQDAIIRKKAPIGVFQGQQKRRQDRLRCNLRWMWQELCLSHGHSFSRCKRPPGVYRSAPLNPDDFTPVESSAPGNFPVSSPLVDLPAQPRHLSRDSCAW